MEIFNILEEGNIAEIIGFIEKENIDINIADDFSYNFLMKAIIRSLSDLAIYLINKGVDLNYQNNKGQTVLHILAVFYNEKVLEEILKKGIDVNLFDKFGNEALWTAVFNDKGLGNERKRMIELLVKYGGNPNHLNNAGRSPKQFAEMAKYDESILKILKK